MSTSAPAVIVPTVVLGNPVTLRTTTAIVDPVSGVSTPTDDPGLQLLIRKPDGTTVVWTILANQITHDATGSYHAIYDPDELGFYSWRWLGDTTVPGAAEGTFEAVSTFIARVVNPNDIRVMVPRVRRAVEGVVQATWLLTDDQVKDLVADAMAAIILYTGEDAGGLGNLFGVTLSVLSTDVNGAPVEYATSAPLDLPVQTVIASQAALDYFFHKWNGVKVTETISDEASHWSYGLSATLLTAQLKHLQDQRDQALRALEMAEGVLDSYTSFIAARDRMTSRFIEPWVWGHPEGYGVGAGGMEGDFRFDVIASGGGDFMLGNGGQFGP